ncbi:MAG: ABC transporter substrate-binding protein [Dehalococcoidia bacterium]|nr:ABC transporter substrate-binding protein [Dehalococcoidia bacterium]MYD27735.1 ABC transporter substrate-binding protein [Dehalococcoidia bacterium]
MYPKRRNWGPWLAVVAALALVAGMLAACDDEEQTPLKIGVLLVNSETQTDTALDRLRAFKLAIKHVNEAGGIFGQPVEIVEGDTLNPQEEARRLIQEGVHAIVGPNSSADSLLVIEVAAPAGVLVISPSASSPLLTANEDRDLFFRTVLSDVAQGPALAQLTRERGFDNVGVIYRDDAWGQGLAAAFQEAWMGGIVAVSSPAELQESYLDLIEESAREGAQALVLLTFWPEGEIILREALDSGLYEQFLFGDALRVADVAEAVGGGRLADMYGTVSSPSHENPSTAIWEEAFRDEYGRDTEATYVRETYDATIAIALAAEEAGEAEGTAIRDALRGIGAGPGEHVRPGVEGIAHALSLIRDGDEVDYAGASVSMDWDEHGDLRRGYIGIWRFTADAAIEDIDVIAYER